MHHEIRRAQLSCKRGKKKKREREALEEGVKVSPIIIALKGLRLQMKLEYRRLWKGHLKLLTDQKFVVIKKKNTA